MSDFEIVPRNEGKPDPKEDQPSTLSILETIAGWFGQAIAAIIGGVGQVIAGVAIGAVEFAGAIVDAAKQIAGGIAKAIKGEGASMKVISGAVDERLGPIDTAISQSGEKMLEIGEKVDESIREQDRIHEQMVENSEQLKEAIAESERVQKERVAVENTLRNEIAASLRAAESAQESADGKSTIYYGSNTPKSPKDGDTWFKPVDGGTQIQVLENGKWVNRSDTAEFDKSLKANAQAIKNLTEVELPKISASTAGFNQALASEKTAREKALKTLGTKLDEAGKDLERLGTARPGNVWPDPHFKDPCWVGNDHRWVNPNNNGGELTFRANGNQIGMYYQPQGKHDKALMLERGAKYLLTATVWRNKNLPDKTTISVHMRQNGKRITAVGRLPTGPAGVSVESVILEIPNTIGGGGSTLGFFIEKDVKQGAVSIWDVQIVRAADDAMIIDGAVTAAKVHAGAIDTNHLAADAVKAGKIASDAVSARELKADSVYAKHIVANEITGDKLKANEITSREVKSNSIMAEHLVIGGPANMIANGGLTEGAEPWDKALHIQNIDESQELPPGNRYAITKPGQSTIAAHTGNQWFAVTPNSMYAFEIWMWADKPGSRFFLELRNQYGRHAGKALRDKVNSADINAGTGDYLMNNIEIRQGWNKYSTVYQTGKDSTRARLGGFYFNHPNGKERNARIAFTGVSLRPMADADLIVDGSILAQHIKADQITGREIKSGTINADQLVVNKGFIKTAMIGDGQITSAKISELDAGKIKTGELDGQRIKANSITVKELRANSIVPIGGSLIVHEPPPSDTTKPPEPIWWKVFNTELSENYRGWPRPEGNPWRTSSNALGKVVYSPISSRLVKVQPGQKYRLQFWCRATVPNTSMIIEMWDQRGRNAVKSGAVSGNVKTGNFQTAKEAKQPWPVTDFSKSTAGADLVDRFILPTEATKVTSTIEFKDGVEYVCLGSVHFNHWSGSNKGNQWIAGLSLELDIPDQAQVDRLQDENIKRLAETSDLNSRFVDEQKKTNRMVQQQQWIHQDMIELLDVRTPKIYGWPAGYSNGGYVTCPYNNRKGHLIQMPYHEQWECGDGSGSEVVVAARGQWSGWMHVSINWDSGVVDDWAVPVENDQNNRIYLFEGGAHHIKKRSISVEIYPRSLNRTASVRIYDASGKLNLSGDKSLKPRKWANSEDKNRLFRSAPAGYVRPKNTVTCDKDIWVRNERDLPYPIKAGEHIYAAVIYPEDQRYADGTKFTFTEIDDPVRMDSRDNFGYGTDKKRAVGKVTRRYSKA